MLKVNKNTEIFEAVSETPDGQIIMTFKAQVDKTNPADSMLDVKKESEQLYRQYRDMASADRADFQDDIFRMIDEYEHPRPVEEPEIIDGEFIEAKDIIPEEYDTEEVISNAQD